MTVLSHTQFKRLQEKGYIDASGELTQEGADALTKWVAEQFEAARKRREKNETSEN